MVFDILKNSARPAVISGGSHQKRSPNSLQPVKREPQLLSARLGKKLHLQRDTLAHSFSGANEPLPAAKSLGVMALLDNFETATIPLYASGEGGDAFVSHGDITAAHALLNNRQVAIRRIQAPLSHTPTDGIGTDMEQAIEKLRSDIEVEPVKPDAINLSAGLDISLHRLRQDLKVPEMGRDNLADYKDYIRKNLQQVNFWANNLEKSAQQIQKPVDIALLDEIASELNTKRPPLMQGVQQFLKQVFGKMFEIDVFNQQVAQKTDRALKGLDQVGQHTPIFLSAGNDGPEYLNMLLLAQNTRGVGSIGKDGRPASWSGRNGLVKTWARTDTKFLPVLGNYGDLAGFKLVDGDHPKRVLKLREHRPQIPANRVHFMNPLMTTPWEEDLKETRLKGTSYASPQAAAREAERSAK